MLNRVAHNIVPSRYGGADSYARYMQDPGVGTRILNLSLQLHYLTFISFTNQ